jgi:malonyl CoA-acyl carrier protein transacylase
MHVFLFPGQGSQYAGMGGDLFDDIAEFAQREAEIDWVLGCSVRELCLKDPGGRLKQTQFTQPALFVVNALHLRKAEAEGRSAEFLAGHSLGEYNALHAAGAFDLIDGVRIVRKRGELMARATGGAMAAVLGLTAERLETVLGGAGVTDLDFANYNAPTQIVLSGSAAAITAAEPVLTAAGAKVVRLPVSAAFHSRDMAQAATEFRAFLRTFRFRDLTLPVMSNVTGRPYPEGAADGIIKARLAEQVASPVRWHETIQYLIEHEATSFEEIGPGRVLTRLNQQIDVPASA